jgi:hypothetical protein
MPGQVCTTRIGRMRIACHRSSSRVLLRRLRQASKRPPRTCLRCASPERSRAVLAARQEDDATNCCHWSRSGHAARRRCRSVLVASLGRSLGHPSASGQCGGRFAGEGWRRGALPGGRPRCWEGPGCRIETLQVFFNLAELPQLLRYLRKALIKILKMCFRRQRLGKQVAKLVDARKLPSMHRSVPPQETKHDRDQGQCRDPQSYPSVHLSFRISGLPETRSIRRRRELSQFPGKPVSRSRHCAIRFLRLVLFVLNLALPKAGWRARLLTQLSCS